eukprot:743098-Karenia_brevis.AAC.1
MAIPRKNIHVDKADESGANKGNATEVKDRWRKVGYVHQHASWYAYGFADVKCIPWYGDMAVQFGQQLLHERVIVDRLPHAGIQTAGKILRCAIDTIST